MCELFAKVIFILAKKNKLTYLFFDLFIIFSHHKTTDMQIHPTFYCLFLLFPYFNGRAQMSEKFNLSVDSTVNRLASLNRVYYATRINSHPKIDGKLNDACWVSGIWDGNFVQQSPLQGKFPSQKTEIKILYDNNNLYVGIKCYDKGKIRPILSRRDEMAGDYVGIAFDSYHDKLTAYEFDVSAAGQKIDQIHLGNYNTDLNWDAVWDGKAWVSDSIWTSEMQIPFSQIRFAPGDKQVWGMHLMRWIDLQQEEDHWKLVPIDAPSMVYLFGELRGIEGVRPKTNFEFLPYLNTRFSPNTDQENKMRYGAGLDGKIGLNSGFKLEYTFNPDFGQVESDPAVLNLTSYEVFNEEKRPFFLEGNTILDFSLGDDMLFYSRRIGHSPGVSPDLNNVDASYIYTPENTTILSALKLTGKTKNGLSVGVVQSLTSREDATIQKGVFNGDSISRMAIEPFTNYMVGRIKQDFDKGNTVLGGMITSNFRNINDDHLKYLASSAITGGIDFQHNWRKRKYFVDFKGVFSDIHGDSKAITQLQRTAVHYYQRTDANYLNFNPESTNLSGWGGFLQGGKRSGKFRAIGSLNWRSPGVDFNDVGYLYQADIIKQTIKLTYKVSEPRGILRSYYTEFTQEHDWSFGGETTLDRLNLHGFLQFNNLWLVHLNLRRNFNIFDTRELRGGPKLFKDDNNDLDLYIQTNSIKDFWAGFGPRFTRSADKISKANYFTAYFKWQLSDRFSITSRTVINNTVDNSEFIPRSRYISESTKYIVGTIDFSTISSTLRLEYFVSPEFSLQYYGNPYTLTGKFTNFREVADASNKTLGKRYTSLSSITPGKYELQNESKQTYSITRPYIKNQQFNSNLVARWEFRPGSTLYVVWTNTRYADSAEQDQSVWKSFGSIWNAKAENVFMIKFSYWFSL